ncbi:microtubule-associated protein 1B-like isoform X3 [Pristis pectinata]|uniref:microtubule-associated protein 1B-like isoform X3 n=1 Tax=Pristis pectinata TaxID=685728 RepID=UPI00223C9B19|nr:microtubule-associated protein 1B-like isoform X3 [Pristis pectinata]XP_051874302.1 microtubule-associated protein 1B-like isoform X3 [Pristis pectinata]XP_051874303.1 microtubule-associated protein 1B-like isoform X3 [Pristis pectinata]
MSTNLVTDKQLMILAGKIGNNFQYLAIGHLGFTTPEFDQFMSEAATQQDKVFRMLYKWKCRQKRPTITSLIRILEKAKVHPDALEYLKSEYNNGKKIKKIQSVNARKRKEPCELEIPKRKINKPESSAVVKNLSDSHAKELGTSSSYEHPLKQMKIQSYSKQEGVSEAIVSTLAKKEDAVQLKSKEKSAGGKGKQGKMPVTKKRPEKKQEAKPNQPVQETTSAKMPVTKKRPEKKQEAKPNQPVQETTSAKMPVTKKRPKKKQEAKPNQPVQETTSAIKKVKKITAKAKPPKKKLISTQISDSLQMKDLFKQKNLSLKSKEESVQTKIQKKMSVTKKCPEKKQEAKPNQPVQETTSATKSEKTFEVVFLS